MIAQSLNWNSNYELRTTKAFFQIKRILSTICNLTTKLDAYIGYVVPSVTFASQVRLTSGTNMFDLEKNQKLATKWILCTNENYRARLTNLKRVRLCLYAELHDPLFLSAIMRREYDNTLNLQEKPPEANQKDTRGRFKIPKSRLQKTDNDFSRRT